MKTIIKHIIIALFILTLKISLAQTLFVDDFNYPVRDSLEGMGTWYRSGLNSPYNVRIVSPGLTYTGYPGSGIGNCVFFSNNPQGDIVLNYYALQTSGRLYMAFMFMVDSMTQASTQGYNIGFDQSGGATNLNTRLYLQKVSSSTFRVGVNKTDVPVYGASIYNTGTTYLAVLKYTFTAGTDNDSSKVFIFSSGVPAIESASPEAFTTLGPDLPDQGEVFLSNLYAQGTPSLSNSPVRIDGIRIGTTWLNAVLTNVNIVSSQIPDGFKLEQNYPNPFNPATNINFSIPKPDFVKLVVFDITGSQIAVLVDQQLNAGTYNIDFNASKLPSGMYFYRITAGKFTQTKKMILIK